LNQKINQMDEVKEIYVYPAMGDSGLALGAAYLKAVELGELKQYKLDTVFLGTEYSDLEVDIAALEYADIVETEYSLERIGNAINDGYVLGVFDGKFEFGPRALGNRSIVVRPTDVDTHRKLNERLGRHEIMPFAPAVMMEHSDTIFKESKSKFATQFMTVCYDTKEEWVDRIPAVVHKVDGTARPQLVDKKINRHFYDIIESYYKLSGIPVVLNTSFNGHGEPIISSPKYAFDHLNRGTIDFLVINGKIYEKK